MPEIPEVKPDDKPPVTEKVTDAALSSAFDAMAEEKKPEGVKVELPAKEVAVETTLKKEELDDDALDQKTRSWMGRKIAGMRDQIRQELEEEIEQKVLQKLKSREEPKPDEVPEIISTAEDVHKVIEARERKKFDGQQKYEQSYVKTARSFAKDNQEIHEDIWKEMMANHNVIRTGNPEVDAELNYLRAKTVVVGSKGVTKPVVANVRSERPEVSTNISTESREPSTPPPTITLDPDAKEYLRRIGKGEDWAQEALKGEAPIHLASRR